MDRLATIAGLFGITMLLGLGGCASAKGATVRQLQGRAVFDLGCPHQQLVVYDVDARTKAVAGCGRRLVYVESCQRIRGEFACTWVMNTPTVAQAQWPGWQRGAPTYVMVRQQLPGPGRPVATELFEPTAPYPASAAAPPLGAPAAVPLGAPAAVPSARGPGSSQAPASGAKAGQGRRVPTNLFGPDGRPATTGQGERSIPTELFDPADYHPQSP